jgi:hypothetical protein
MNTCPFMVGAQGNFLVHRSRRFKSCLRYSKGPGDGPYLVP